ncbi:TerD family protein [Streptacidiphilus sp. EB129]|uniref:TerD family protein n=1 Tax=Streptacidiphilus sp. EB129 TaxID=3156262 RepID=UPI003511A122
MTKVLPKGSNTTLGGSVAAVRAVLRWRIVPGTPDVDVSALLLGADGRVRSDEDFVFYNQPRHPTGLVRHRSKARLDGEVTDTIDIDLDRLPAEVHRVVVGGSVEGGSFGDISGLHILLFDIAGGPGAEPLARFDITDTSSVTALLCGELYRRGGAWKFRAIGQGYSSGLVGLATDFGITVEEDEEAAPPAASQQAGAVPETVPAQQSQPQPQPDAPPRPQPQHEPAPEPPASPVNPPPVNPPPVSPPPVTGAPPTPGTGYGYPPPRPTLLPEPAGFALPLQGPQFQPNNR